MRAAAFLLGALLSTGALAQSCPSGEYSQYKDRAATEEGLELLARDYCVSRVMLQEGYKQRCVDEMTKITDAATAAGAGDKFKAMTVDMDACRANGAKIRSRRPQ